MSERSALVIIDVQVGVIEGARPIYAGAKLLDRIASLAARAREAGVPVIYVQDGDVGRGDQALWQIHPAVAPQAGDTVVHKKSTDAFHQTELHAVLQGLNVTRLLVSGCKTEYCVDTTCRRATTLGYDVTLIQDAHSTTDNEVLSAAQIIAHHNWHLDGLDNLDHEIMVLPSAEIRFEA